MGSLAAGLGTLKKVRIFDVHFAFIFDVKLQLNSPNVTLLHQESNVPLRINDLRTFATLNTSVRRYGSPTVAAPPSPR